MDKIAASHILIMHKDSKDSRSDLSKDDALNIINDIYEKLKKNKKLFKDLASKHSIVPSSWEVSGQVERYW